IRPEMKIVSIEDTPELRLPHPNWVPEVAREGFGFGERSTGEVTLDDLLKESLRQRPDFIIVGEVRGEEAYILFQQMATGHPGMSTIHASSLEKIMNRLTTKPIDLPLSLLDNLDLIVFAKRTRRQGSYVRRVGNIYEFLEYDKEREEPVVNNVFEWRAADDTFINPTDSTLLSEISEEHGISKTEVQEEIMRRKKILMWMKQRGIKHYQEVGRVISTYYHHPDQIMDRVEAEL
ncbi:MAG: CpaF/VirB11 family protein, partial [Candidatus Nanohaloarchaea archaeon]|nr:CpaF/VirB11 family protein [Candidatus Nanohaloarchaea archaeon]